MRRDGRVVTCLAVGLSVYALYWVLFVVQPQIYRGSFLAIALTLVFLVHPARSGSTRLSLLDLTLIGLTIAALGWPILDFERFVYRAADPWPLDVVLGAIAILLVLEAARRTVGWVLPVTAAAFMAYAYAGPLFDRLGMPILAHRGYPLPRIVGTLYMTLEGIFGVPLDVTATYIILFTIYGAVLEESGAGRFFIDWAMAAMGRSRSGAAPGRAVTLAGFLLGTVSGLIATFGAIAAPGLR